MCHYPNIKKPGQRYKNIYEQIFLKKSEAMKGVNERNNISFNLKIPFTEYKMCFISG